MSKGEYSAKVSTFHRKRAALSVFSKFCKKCILFGRCSFARLFVFINVRNM